MQSLWQDLCYGLRLLRKNRGFSVVVVLILALGIGSNTAIFSVLDPLLIRKLPVQNPDELVWINSIGTLGPAEISEIETYYAYRDRSQVFSSVLAFSRMAPYDIRHDGRTTSATAEMVSPNYFTALGIEPFTGRLFSDIEANGPAMIVLSFDFWKREFHSAPGVVGEALSFADQSDATRSASTKFRSYLIAGVAPPGFSGTEVGRSPDFFVPLGATQLPSQDYWQTDGVTILARLKPGVSIAQAQAELEPILQVAEKASELPEIERNERYAHVLVTPAGRGISEARAKFSLPGRILMGVVAFLLLIACANVASLLLARGTARKREFTLRLALGAGRWRMIRQLLAESMVFAILGTAAGLVLGQWTTRALVAALSTQQLPIVLATAFNRRTLFFAAAVSVITVFLCGLAPAVAATRGELAADLKTNGAGFHGSTVQSRLGGILIVAQVALSAMLLAGAGLLLHSLFKLETLNAGFDRDKVLIVSVNGYSASRDRVQVAGFYDQLIEQVRQLPGVRSASVSSFTPISGKEVGVNIVVEGRPLHPGEVANERFVGVFPGYFATMGIPLLAGRDFTREDAHSNSPSYQSTNVAIINRTMARRFFGDNSPLGKHFRFVEGKRPPIEIVGVVADSKYNSLREGPTDFFYIPGTHGDLVIRTSRSASLLEEPLRQILHSLDGSVTVTSIRTLRQQIDESIHSDRLISALCGAFSFLALALSCVGLYGALAFRVARRTSEIGLRMALGARPNDIFRLVVRYGMGLTVAGLLLGVFAVFSAGSLLTSVLFGVNRADPLAFLGVSATLMLSAFIACCLPARRAMTIEPIVALRNE